MESLTTNWSSLSLSAEEGDKFNFQSICTKKGCTLAAKFYTKRQLNVDAVIKTLRPLWRPKQGFQVRDVGNHILLFTFEEELDAERVLLGEPWSFDKYLIVLRCHEVDKSLSSLCFNSAKFWVQVHDLPLWRMFQEAAGALCQIMGKVIRCTDKTEVEGGHFIKARVELDITKPLC